MKLFNFLEKKNTHIENRTNLAPQGTPSASRRRIHLDYAATTPVHKDVFAIMKPFWSEKWANASAIYQEGVEVREIIESSREKLARTLNVRPSGIVFTGGGTEANNLAILGLVEKLRKSGTEYKDIEIITTKVEHPSILRTVEHLGELGVGIKYVAIDSGGLIDLKQFESLLSGKTKLVTYAYVNSETGVIQPVKKLSRIVKKWNEQNEKRVLVHLDACQAPLWLSCAIDSLGVDMLSLDSGKCYGPKGAGVLARVHDVEIEPIMYGGSQENGLWPGTENPSQIVGCTESIVRAQESHEERSEKIFSIRDKGLALIKKEIPNAVINGSIESRVANNINISLLGIDSEYAVIVLDKHGIIASTRSACGSKKGEGSHVVREMTHDEERAVSTLRFTLGEESVIADLNHAVSVLKTHLQKMESAL